jgi:hypothetical protein
MRAIRKNSPVSHASIIFLSIISLSYRGIAGDKVVRGTQLSSVTNYKCVKRFVMPLRLTPCHCRNILLKQADKVLKILRLFKNERPLD